MKTRITIGAAAGLICATLTATSTAAPVTALAGSRPAPSAPQTSAYDGNTLTPRTADAPGRPATYPSIRNWSGRRGRWSLARSSVILVEGPRPRVAQGVARMFGHDLAAETGRRVPVRVARHGAAARSHDVLLSLGAQDPQLTNQGYRLTVGRVLAIRADARSGLLYGTESVLQIIKADPARTHVPHGTATDWPSLPQRGEMIDVGRKYYPLSYLRSQIRRMAWMKLNMLHLHLTDWNGFRFYSNAYPHLASPRHYTPEQLRSLDQYARHWGVTIVPEIDVPGHSSWLTRWDPRLALKCPSMSVSHWPGGSMGGWVLDVTSPRARTVVKTIIRELASVFSGPYIHIGGDEIPYDADKDKCPKLVNWAKQHGYQYPGDDIVDFINDLDTAVHAAGKKAELWQWWDFNGQQTSIAPRKDIRVDVWLEDPQTKAAQGYKTIGSQDGYLYVSPGYGTVPGQYGYMPAKKIYNSYPFTFGPNIQGYKISRWSDRAENKPPSWFDFYARRPVEVLAERTWGGPRSVTAARFFERVDTIGDPPPSQLTAVPQWRYHLADVSSQETTAENGTATRAFDGNPLTAWSSQYSPVAPLGTQHLTIGLGRRYPVSGVVVEPRQDGKTISNLYDTLGRIKNYRLQLSADDRSWTTVASGTLPDDQTASTITFRPHAAQYVRLVALSDWKAVFVYAIGELTVLRAPNASVRTHSQG